MDLKQFYSITFWSSFIGFILIIFDSGFDQTLYLQHFITFVYFVILVLGMISTYLRYKDGEKSYRPSVLFFDIISVTISLVVIAVHLFVTVDPVDPSPLHDDVWIRLAVFLTFLRELSEQRIDFTRTLVNPAQLFILSFILLIFVGTGLLLLPNATNQEFHVMDALFTATSAVCVTGLIVVDTATYFTQFGQFIILLLIQLGGLGILTFASYFTYFFKGGTTYENQLTISELSNSTRRIGAAFSTLRQILLITLVIEGFSAICIYFSVYSQFDNFADRAFFSVFHSVSAFCNAGFSTLSNGAYDSAFRFNYGFQLLLIFTFVFGGLGFPIVVNVLSYFRYKIRQLLAINKENYNYRPWVLNINSRITLVTTAILILIGFVTFYTFEFHNTLEEHHGFGKVVTALFGATTPRTAGFNSVDMAALRFPTIMVIFFLMWIGASPASTGGGIKTSTFAIATLNILSIAKGKNRIEVFRREISDLTVRRAFAIMSLSLVVIGLGVVLISFFDPEQGLLNIAFECFSAYSTVGLSLGATSSLSFDSKIILILIMFIGRVSMLSVLIAVMRQVRQKQYRYPTEEITIN